MKTYTELPGDRYGNVLYLYNGSRVVILAVQENEHTLRVVEPIDFPWPTVHPGYFTEVSHAPGVVTFEEWAGLVGWGQVGR